MRTVYTNQQLSLHPNQVHIWSVHIRDHTNKLSIYWELLNEKEKTKATQFKFGKDCNCFVIARGVLRKLLGSYLHLKPEEVEFQSGNYGKPYINHSSKIQFNISHSKNVVLMGFILKDTIGVDVEYTQRKIDVKQIAKQFFSVEEYESLLTLDNSCQLQGFYNCWTRKEAFIKALGSGLSFPLDQFVVSLDCTEEAVLKDTKWDNKEKEKWVLQPIKPRENYIGAYAVKGKVSNVKSWKY